MGKSQLLLMIDFSLKMISGYCLQLKFNYEITVSFEGYME